MNFYPFYNNCQLPFQDSNYSYTPVNENYIQFYRIIEEKSQQIKSLQVQNQNLKQSLYQIQNSLQEQQRKNKLIRKPLKNYYRRNAISSQNKHLRYRCPYGECSHDYSSTLALNFHIKSKHNGGNKKQRQAYAKIIVLAQERGQQTPKLNFNFPPGFLQKYRQKHKRQKKSTELSQKTQ